MIDKVQSEEVWVKPKNKGGRPRVKVPKSGVTRETRIPIDGARNKLTVEGKDPNYHYLWELDNEESGNRIQTRRNAGYEFVQAGAVTVGQANVYKSNEYGSIVRVPDGADGYYLYLMRIPMQWHNEDLARHEQMNREQEQSATAVNPVEGQYGSIKLSRK